MACNWLLLHLSVAAASLTRFDVLRAKRSAPRAEFQAPREEVSSFLTSVLEKTSGLEVRPCDDWSLEALDDTLDLLDTLSHPELEAEYVRRGDARGGGRARRAALTELRVYESHVRSARCAEAAQRYAHHLSSEARAEFAATSALPGLNERPGPSSSPAVDAAVANAYTCQTFHSFDATKVTDDDNDHDWPHWPTEATYEGTGYGPFPFWGGAGDLSLDTGANLSVAYSAVHNAERILHSSCDLSTHGGPRDKVECAHLWKQFDLDGKTYHMAWLYTTKGFSADADGAFCCISSNERAQMPLTAPPRDFMDLLDDSGTVDNYTNAYFPDGITVRNYTTAINFAGTTYFWYLTDTAGHPVEQGEGCVQSPRRECHPEDQEALYVYHTYDTTSFKQTTFDYNTTFALPDVCRGIKVECLMP